MFSVLGEDNVKNESSFSGVIYVVQTGLAKTYSCYIKFITPGSIVTKQSG
jgi:hypothetical protein